ncbi:MAG: protein-ADP-ribose hydrolase [Lachnospiraceae bacterium]|nr:protein-ADP-ribose hydrolase [Lachnospiraceae bacterium]
MRQDERRKYLIEKLLEEKPVFDYRDVFRSVDTQKRALRSLMNIRRAAPVSEEFVKVQDDYLGEVREERGVVDIRELREIKPLTYLWQGDITRLRCGAIVNAANSGMTGCYIPCHNCIDNCIHTYAGIELRSYCQKMMDEQGCEEATGQAKITPAFNLPCSYIIHTVGPIVDGRLTEAHEEALRSCYMSCLNKAEEYSVGSVAFCCVSTGVFGFPNQRAGEIAVETVRSFREQTGSRIEVIFNVWKDIDYEIYEKLLREC